MDNESPAKGNVSPVVVAFVDRIVNGPVKYAFPGCGAPAGFQFVDPVKLDEFAASLVFNDTLPAETTPTLQSNIRILPRHHLNVPEPERSMKLNLGFR
jgi:hypothetical protein